MRVWIELLAALVRVLLPWLVDRARPMSESGDPDRQIRDRLAARVRRHWLIVPLVLLLLVVTGCAGGRFTRTIYVPDGTPVRLRETIPSAKVWVKDAGGEVVAGVMDLPEGWYALPVDDQE